MKQLEKRIQGSCPNQDRLLIEDFSNQILTLKSFLENRWGVKISVIKIKKVTYESVELLYILENETDSNTVVVDFISLLFNKD